MHPSIKAVASAGLLITLACVGACSHSDSVAESRARAFVRALVIEPDNQEGLAELSALAPRQTPDDLLDGVLAHVAIDYLRAKKAQGTELTFAVADKKELTENSMVVTVTVAESPTHARTRLRVTMQDTPEHGWLVTGVQGAP